MINPSTKSVLLMINKIVIHCADTFADMDIGAKEIDR